MLGRFHMTFIMSWNCNSHKPNNIAPVYQDQDQDQDHCNSQQDQCLMLNLYYVGKKQLIAVSSFDDIFGLFTLDPHTNKYMFSSKLAKHAEELG